MLVQQYSNELIFTHLKKTIASKSGWKKLCRKLKKRISFAYMTLAMVEITRNSLVR
ncbi:hypothetical protein FC25_GL001837 [Ligilactobacillus ruminis DSM 20403 = NBRC 102161]|uniref:Uncharacterized protein n=1 Tax=Ligilactobacillus ruminis (strain ATCC 27782 / RF3) TaxID=1069534 RepID=G2SRJ8_LIGR2|nr:Hypothetical protein LRC_16130 [Ligilactobacillus ruminis ATCC 27782]AJA34265.1 hypothetical protein [Ligilactobacillus ruminis ATCC 27782]KRM83230.1 hypothetical protein FC25_GL001837 [Ligilactobacillus ruminis DSM 20403 = NBRC 102161]